MKIFKYKAAMGTDGGDHGGPRKMFSRSGEKLQRVGKE